MTTYDISKILKEYGDFDFGFSTVSEEEYNSAITTVINEKETTEEEYRARLLQLEKLVLPFFTKLLSTADQPYIYWPNRKVMVEEQIQKILSLTRG